MPENIGLTVISPYAS